MQQHPLPTILLMGPPNVGKSVIFSRLTGLNVSCANYPGTTVSLSAGRLLLNDLEAVLLDVPGTYTLSATNEAELVAVSMLKGHSQTKLSDNSHCGVQSNVNEEMISGNRPAAALCVIDAVNLESSLFLLLQVLHHKIPVVAVLNRIDLASDRGRSVDTSYLSRELGIPVVPTIAIEGRGLEEIKNTLSEIVKHGFGSCCSRQYVPSSVESDNEETLWHKAEALYRKAVGAGGNGGRRAERRHKLGLKMLKPWPGIPIALAVLTVVFGIVVGLGMGLRQLLLLPLFRGLLIPVISGAVEQVTGPGTFRDILIGEYGFLVKGLEWPFALVMPYVISFYFALSLLEDSGYMPRLAGLVDGILNRVGLRGSGIIPLILGYGCGIPAIMATRALGSRKERLVVTAMICMAVPCVSQTGAIISLLAERSIIVVVALFTLSFLVLAGTGLVVELLVRGKREQTVMEVPELLPPRLDVVGKKVWMRIKNYLTDGALPMIGAVALAAVLYESGAMAAIGRILSPLVTQWLRLPQEASVPLVLGILRRELSVLPLMEMDLTLTQLFVGAAVGLFYVPCIAIVATVAREFSLKLSLIMLLATSSFAFLMGGLISRTVSLFF